MTDTLPLFPLGTVLLPGASLPLHIFEPRYRQLMVDLVTGAVPGRSFGVVAVKQGWEVGEDNLEAWHEIGCTALLREVRRLDDGRFDVVVRGQRRFRLLAVDGGSAPYLLGQVEWMPDAEPALGPKPTVLADAARAAHRRYCTTAWRQEDWKEPSGSADFASLSHELAADCMLPLEDQQRLLEETCPIRRLRLVRRMLTREAEILRTLRAVPVPLTEFAQKHSEN
ncbi:MULTISPECIES: LON peptidase substrate-binding domain-containing protein [unclassified Crossiella]|uniref:LON peptidase substrate-binding domain-containing protein n=1 Tax=Crossiella sp. CA-258035 TaxID=2981138 RepID=UPI0024BC0D79|nr:LON peptidase substrate-binding domain-containing protein [Crossiella sp. CA-258035]WHT17835.1 LON peptidase substrate-binding domain-containing protein [Crossiella sp. CA-258035]